MFVVCSIVPSLRDWLTDATALRDSPQGQKLTSAAPRHSHTHAGVACTTRHAEHSMSPAPTLLPRVQLSLPLSLSTWQQMHAVLLSWVLGAVVTRRCTYTLM